MNKTEQCFCDAISAAQETYELYLNNEVERVVLQISKRRPDVEVGFQGGMGSFFFHVGDDNEYMGSGAQAMLKRLEEALDWFGWNVVPQGIMKARAGKLTYRTGE